MSEALTTTLDDYSLAAELETSHHYVELPQTVLANKLTTYGPLLHADLMPSSRKRVDAILGRLTFELAVRQAVAEEECGLLEDMYGHETAACP